MENGDDPLGGLADFRYTCSYSVEAAQGVVSVDVNAARKTDWLDKTVYPCREARHCFPRTFRTVNVGPRFDEAVRSSKLLAKGWSVQSALMNGSELHKNLGGRLVSGLIVDALSLLVAMYPFGMLLVDRIYESVFSNLQVRFNVPSAFNSTLTHKKGRVCDRKSRLNHLEANPVHHKPLHAKRSIDTTFKSVPSQGPCSPKM